MKRTWLFGILPLLSIGCDQTDGDRLTRVGRKVTEKVQALIPNQTPFGDVFPANRPRGLEDRVRERLKMDRYLATSPIEVIADGAVVRLRGTVNDPVLKRRAFEIADSTVGVEKVVDEIVVVK